MSRANYLSLPTVISLALLSGCSTITETYPGHPADQVWTAMQAVAESPEYDDWHVVENETWVDPDLARIEIYRVNRRVLHRPGAKPLDEKRTWKFQVLLVDVDPPTAAFKTRSFAIPAQAQVEAEQYLEDVWQVLGGRPEPVEAVEDETGDE